MIRRFIFILLTVSLLAACSATQSTPPPVITKATQSPNATEVVNDPTSTPDPESTATSTPTTQPIQAKGSYGPDQFPQGYNPLTGQPMIDLEWLKIPAVLLSVSHFPPVARPQAGFSFAPFVYEYTITEGSTRHLAVFYGEFPKPEVPVQGDC